MRLGQPAYLYFFAHHYPRLQAPHLEAFHGSELPYEFARIGAPPPPTPANGPRAGRSWSTSRALPGTARQPQAASRPGGRMGPVVNSSIFVTRRTPRAGLCPECSICTRRSPSAAGLQAHSPGTSTSVSPNRQCRAPLELNEVVRRSPVSAREPRPSAVAAIKS